MQMTVRFMAPVRLPPFPVCRPTSLQLSTTYLPGCIVIGSSKMLRRLRWCDAHRLVDSRNFLDVPSRSLVLPLNRSAQSMIWASTSTATLAPPPTFEEPCRGVLLHYGNFVSYVDTSPMTVFVLSWSRSSTPGSTMATSYSSGFLSTSSDAFKPCLKLQFVWCSDSVATITCPTPSWYYTGCVCRNWSTSNWRSWHIVC